MLEGKRTGQSARGGAVDMGENRWRNAGVLMLGIFVLFAAFGCSKEDPRRSDEVWELVLDITEEGGDASYQSLIAANLEAFDALVAMGNPGLYNMVRKLRTEEGTLVERQVLMAAAAAISGVGASISDPDAWLAYYDGNPNPLIDESLLVPLGEVGSPYSDALLEIAGGNRLWPFHQGVLGFDVQEPGSIHALTTQGELLWSLNTEDMDFNPQQHVTVFRDQRRFVLTGKRVEERLSPEEGLWPLVFGPLTVASFNAEGEELWRRDFPDYENHFAVGVYETPEGDLLLLGTATFLDAWPNPEGTSTIVVHRLSSDGALLDTKFYGGWGEEYLNEVLPTEEGLLLYLQSSSRESRFHASQSGELATVVALLDWSLELRWSTVLSAEEHHHRSPRYHLWDRGWVELLPDISTGRTVMTVKVYEGPDRLLRTMTVPGDAMEGFWMLGGRTLLLGGESNILMDIETGETTSMDFQGSPGYQMDAYADGFLLRTLLIPQGEHRLEESYILFTFLNWKGELVWRRAVKAVPQPQFGR